MVGVVRPGGWRRSSKCDSAGCVDVWLDASSVQVRNSTDEDGPVLRFDVAAWAVFVRGVAALSAERQTPA
ncbi:DUF397 domain-containing protein [Dactylosporangium vinaceum]|uniref:DUF397 domain-containing protein n=1 Tax=Dactylosporangium vinaceum TaxID=53362 RepID=A0ABV5MPF0_9ACTN|nr:DUF397 domain-containing protein [Dactylosporangium vinaceum]